MSAAASSPSSVPAGSDIVFALGDGIQGAFSGKTVGHVLELSNGQFIAQVGHSLYRFSGDGFVDPTYGGWAGVLVDDLFPGAWFYVDHLAARPDGGVFLIGVASSKADGLFKPAIASLDSSGRLDTTFGGTGMFSPSAPADLGRWESIADGTLQPDGKLIIVDSYFDNAWSLQSRLTLTRLNADGTVDRSFGQQGSVRLPDDALWPSKLLIDRDGGLLLVSRTSHANVTTLVVSRYGADVILDTSYGDHGRVLLDMQGTLPELTGAAAQITRPVDALLQPDGKLLIAASVSGYDRDSHSIMAVVRVTADGAADSTFGAGGRAIYTKIPYDYAGGGPAWKSADPVALHVNDDGSILLTGVGHVGFPDFTSSGTVVVKMTANGTPDPKFGEAGYLLAHGWGGLNYPNPLGFVVQHDGQVDVLGKNTFLGGEELVLIPLKNGQLDPSVGPPLPVTTQQVRYTPGTTVVLAPDLMLFDQRFKSIPAEYGGSTLTVARRGGAQADDHFAVGSGSADHGQILLRGTEIGTWVVRAGAVTATFNQSASNEGMLNFIQAVTFSTDSPLHAGEAIDLVWTFQEDSANVHIAGGALTASFTSRVTVQPAEAPAWIEQRLGTGLAAGASAYREAHAWLMDGGGLLKADLVSKAYSAQESAVIQQALAAVANVTGLKLDAAGLPIHFDHPGKASPADGYRVLTRAGGEIDFDFPAGPPATALDALTERISAMLGIHSSGGLSDLNIAALQYLYGPDPAVRAGNDVYLLKEDSANFIWDGNGTDTISAAALTRNVTLHLEPGAWDYIGRQGSAITDAGQITVNYGSAIENAIGGSGNDWLSGTAAANTLQGGAGDDHLNGMGGSDKLDGGAGLDTALFDALRQDATINVANGSGTVATASGTSTLVSVERLHFSDGDVAVDAGAAQLYRLYQAAFGRAADPSGFGYWLAAEDRGTPLDAIAATFLASPEFARRYGQDVSDAQFLTNLYQNVLHRAPDESGYAFWIGKLDAHAISRTGILLQFTDSPENTGQVAAVVAKGIDYVPWG